MSIIIYFFETLKANNYAHKKLNSWSWLINKLIYYKVNNEIDINMFKYMKLIIT